MIDPELLESARGLVEHYEECCEYGVPLTRFERTQLDIGRAIVAAQSKHATDLAEIQRLDVKCAALTAENERLRVRINELRGDWSSAMEGHD